MADRDEQESPPTLEEIVAEVRGVQVPVGDEAGEAGPAPAEKPDSETSEADGAKDESEEPRGAELDVRARLKEAGFDDDTIDALGDDLESALARDDRRLIDAFRVADRQTAEEDESDEEAEVEPEPERERETPSAAPDALDIDEEAIDPEVLKAIRALEKQNRDLRGQVGELLAAAKDAEKDEAETEAATRQAVNDWYDQRFEELGPEWQDVFGVGKVDEVAPAHLRARQVLSDAVRALYLSYESRGRKVPSSEELFERALLATYPDRAVKRASKRDADASRAARQRHAATGVARPSGRKRKPATPQERAEAHAAEWLRSRRA